MTARDLPVATELAGVNMRLKPGGIRELHWHKEAEWSYVIAGTLISRFSPTSRRLFVCAEGWVMPRLCVGRESATTDSAGSG